EDSEVRTNAYRTHFSDRWIRDELQIFAGGATGVDILDRHKIGRDPGNCSRNENTASEGGGVFVANKDGCVRAIRSYMGFNSAPYLQRQHFFYEQQQTISTYIRAHDTVSDFRDLYDYSPAASGMRYFNDLNLPGVLIDGVPDDVNHGQIHWEMVTGVQGTIIMCHSRETDIPNYRTHSFYGDDATPERVQCTGDPYQYGTSGLDFDPVSFTDPVLYPTSYSSLAFSRIDCYGAPSQTIDAAILHHLRSTTPLQVKAVALTPPPPIFVDNDAGNDPIGNDPRSSDPLEDGSPEHPFDTIQEALDYAWAGDTVIVLDGAHTGAGNHDLDFKGKAITLRSQNGPSGCIIDGQDRYRGFVFHSGEHQDTVLRGLTIANCAAERGAGVSCVDGSNPTITNCIFRENSALGSKSRAPDAYGGAVYCQASSPQIVNCTFYGNSAKTKGGAVFCEGGASTVTNCIFSVNKPDHVYGTGVNVTYSAIQGGWKGEGNMDRDPLFADASQGDFHLKSQAGRWDPVGKRWTADNVTSLCIDAGDPAYDVGSEPEPNGDRINLGAYGGSVEASKSR
ncbi:MAG: right-handed parallel beta-helix repeat-containing protein, partial [Planctomycetes bacterium]|nr:right-handed parallel beta-helix repeat-containing protein [Planctomycetota bacterium]